MKQKLQKYLDDCIKLRIPPSFDIVLGTFIKYYKISQLIHTQIIAN